MNIEQDLDFTTQTVPDDHQTNGLGIMFIWMGFIMVVATMSFGGGLAAQMDFSDLAYSILIGNCFLAVVSFFSGYIGSASGLTFGTLISRVFVKGTWKIALLYIPLSLIGWYAIEAAIFGNLIADTFELSEVTRRSIMALSALFFASSAYFGIRFMGKISVILVPLVVLISIYALFHVLQTDAESSFGFSNERIGMSKGIEIVMSTWIFSVLLVIPDLTRFIKSPIRAGFVAALGVFIANILALGIGAFAAALTKESDPSLILTSIGFAPLAILLSFAGIWSTNDNNMYSSALGVSKVLSIPRKKVVIGLAILGAVIASFNPATISTMFAFLVFMGASAPALGGIVLGSYLESKTRIPKVPPSLFAPWLAWILTSVVTFQLSGPIVVPIGILLGYLLWTLFNRALSKFSS